VRRAPNIHLFRFAGQAGWQRLGIGLFRFLIPSPLCLIVARFSFKVDYFFKEGHSSVTTDENTTKKKTGAKIKTLISLTKTFGRFSAVP
jgi:hypothetical protein